MESLIVRTIVRRFLRIPRGVTQKGFIQKVLFRNLGFNHRFLRGKNTATKFQIIVMLRVRNEELLIKDALDHLSTFADGAIIYDDDSTDSTVKISLEHPLVIEVIQNKRWRANGRIWEETANRRLLLGRTSRYAPQWVFYCDADERFEGDIRHSLLSQFTQKTVAVRVRLLDAYLTAEDFQPFEKDNQLLNFRTYFGPERREILMAWRPSNDIEYFLPDSREPAVGSGEISTAFWCQHYGKAISIDEWEATCDYYIANFPDIYKQRWSSRKGKSLHIESDFGAPLMNWEDAQKNSYLL